MSEGDPELEDVFPGTISEPSQGRGGGEGSDTGAGGRERTHVPRGDSQVHATLQL